MGDPNAANFIMHSIKIRVTIICDLEKIGAGPNTVGDYGFLERALLFDSGRATRFDPKLGKQGTIKS